MNSSRFECIDLCHWKKETPQRIRWGERTVLPKELCTGTDWVYRLVADAKVAEAKRHPTLLLSAEAGLDHRTGFWVLSDCQLPIWVVPQEIWIGSSLVPIPFISLHFGHWADLLWNPPQFLKCFFSFSWALYFLLLLSYLPCTKPTDSLINFICFLAHHSPDHRPFSDHWPSLISQYWAASYLGGRST